MSNPDPERYHDGIPTKWGTVLYWPLDQTPRELDESELSEAHKQWLREHRRDAPPALVEAMTFSVKQMNRIERKLGTLVENLDWYAAVLYDQGARILMAFQDALNALVTAISDERSELQAKFDAVAATIAELRAQIDAGGDPALQAKIAELEAANAELQTQLDAGTTALEQATAEVQSLSDTGGADTPPA